MPPRQHGTRQTKLTHRTRADYSSHNEQASYSSLPTITSAQYTGRLDSRCGRQPRNMSTLGRWQQYRRDLLRFFDDAHAPFFHQCAPDPALRAGMATELGGRAAALVCMPCDEHRFGHGSTVQLRIDQASDSCAVSTTYLERIDFWRGDSVLCQESVVTTDYVDGVDRVETSEGNAISRSGNLDLVNWFEVPFTQERWTRLLKAFSDIACDGRFPERERG